MSNLSPTSSPSPPIQLWSPAVDFIDNRMWQYHPAYNTQMMHFNPSQGQFVAMGPSSMIPSQVNTATLSVTSPPQPRPAPGHINDMDFWEEIFPEAMSELRKTPAPKQANQSLWGIRACTTWSDVQAKLEVARKDYDHQHDSQQVGRFRRKVRSALDKSTVPLQQVVKGIPSVEVTSPIISVSNVLLDAYRQAAEVREAVHCAWDDLPAFFATTDAFYKIYSGDQNIHSASVAFVLATLKAIEEAIMFYTSKQASRAGLAILTGEQYQQNLSKNLAQMKERADDLVSQARISQHFHQKAEYAQNRLSHEASHHALGTILFEQRGFLSVIERAYNMVFGLLMDKQTNWQPHSPMPSRPTTPMLIEAPAWTTQEVWSRLHIPHIDEIDMEEVLNSKADIVYSDHGRAQQMLGTAHLRHWMLSANSARLLVHGDFDTSTRLSPFTVLCTALTKAFRTTPKNIGLVFFCGYHLKNNEYHGGVAIIRSLIAQLLRQYPYMTLPPPPELPLQGIDTANLEQLCRLFEYLIRLLPPQLTVYCLLDSIKEYEREEYIDTMDLVVISLIALVDTGSAASFKLLLTSPRPTVEVRKAFDERDEHLLHMQRLPETEEYVGSGALQQRIVGEMEGQMI